MDMLSILVRRSLLLNLHARTPGFLRKQRIFQSAARKGGLTMMKGSLADCRHKKYIFVIYYIYNTLVLYDGLSD